MIKFTVQSEFSAAHFYNQPKWSAEKNKQQFGKCYSPYGHGHNYQLILEFENQNPKDLLTEKNSLQIAIQQLTEKLDHKHLNHEIDFFKHHIPTTENIAVYLLDTLKKNSLKQPTKLILKEMDSLWVEIQL